MRAGCVICGDLFVSTDDINATPCGHTFHSLCIIQWIERSKSCPQCRSKAIEKSLVKLYFDTGGADTSQVDPDTLQNHIDGLKFQVRLKDQEIKNVKDSNATLTKQNKGLREECKKIESQVQIKETTIMALKTQLQFMDRITKEAQKAKDDAKSLRDQLKVLQNVESIVSGTNVDVEDMLRSYAGNPDSTRSLATFCSILKKELNKTVDDKRRFRDEASSLRSKLKEARHNYNATVTELSVLQQINRNLQDDVQSLERENSSFKKKINALEQAISSPSGDVKNSAIHRLIAESPAPAEYKRPHSSISDGDDVLVTPEVVRKVARSETAALLNDVASIQPSQSSLSDSSQFNLKVNLFPGRRPLIKICHPTNSQHHNIFAKNKPSLKDLGTTRKTSSGHHVGLNQTGYDGLGGHHKVDEFPKPKQVFLKKKSGIKVVNKGGSGSMVQSITLKDFFQNTFDD